MTPTIDTSIQRTDQPPVINNDPRATINRANGRGRDAGDPAPPAQIRTCGIPAYGSYLG